MADTIAVDELVDGQSELKLLLAADANVPVAGVLLDRSFTGALVAGALCLAPDVQDAVGVPNLMALWRARAGPGAASQRSILSADVGGLLLCMCPTLADARAPRNGALALTLPHAEF